MIPKIATLDPYTKSFFERSDDKVANITQKLNATYTIKTFEDTTKGLVWSNIAHHSDLNPPKAINLATDALHRPMILTGDQYPPLVINGKRMFANNFTQGLKTQPYACHLTVPISYKVLYPIDMPALNGNVWYHWTEKWVGNSGEYVAGLYIHDQAHVQYSLSKLLSAAIQLKPVNMQIFYIEYRFTNDTHDVSILLTFTPTKVLYGTADFVADHIAFPSFSDFIETIFTVYPQSDGFIVKTRVGELYKQETFYFTPANATLTIWGEGCVVRSVWFGEGDLASPYDDNEANGTLRAWYPYHSLQTNDILELENITIDTDANLAIEPPRVSINTIAGIAPQTEENRVLAYYMALDAVDYPKNHDPLYFDDAIAFNFTEGPIYHNTITMNVDGDVTELPHAYLLNLTVRDSNNQIVTNYTYDNLTGTIYWDTTTNGTYTFEYDYAAWATGMDEIRGNYYIVNPGEQYSYTIANLDVPFGLKGYFILNDYRNIEYLKLFFAGSPASYTFKAPRVIKVSSSISAEGSLALSPPEELDTKLVAIFKHIVVFRPAITARIEPANGLLTLNKRLLDNGLSPLHLTIQGHQSCGFNLIGDVIYTNTDLFLRNTLYGNTYIHNLKAQTATHMRIKQLLLYARHVYGVLEGNDTWDIVQLDSNLTPTSIKQFDIPVSNIAIKNNVFYVATDKGLVEYNPETSYTLKLNNVKTTKIIQTTKAHALIDGNVYTYAQNWKPNQISFRQGYMPSYTLDPLGIAATDTDIYWSNHYGTYRTKLDYLASKQTPYPPSKSMAYSWDGILFVLGYDNILYNNQGDSFPLLAHTKHIHWDPARDRLALVLNDRVLTLTDGLTVEETFNIATGNDTILYGDYLYNLYPKTLVIYNAFSLEDQRIIQLEHIPTNDVARFMRLTYINHKAYILIASNYTLYIMPVYKSLLPDEGKILIDYYEQKYHKNCGMSVYPISAHVDVKEETYECPIHGPVSSDEIETVTSETLMTTYPILGNEPMLNGLPVFAPFVLTGIQGIGVNGENVYLMGPKRIIHLTLHPTALPPHLQDEDSGGNAVPPDGPPDNGGPDDEPR